MSETVAQRIAVLLASYEADAPHFDEIPEEQMYLARTWEQIAGWLEMEHHGDCMNLCITCARCVAEDVWHKARWIAERMGG